MTLKRYASSIVLLGTYAFAMDPSTKPDIFNTTTPANSIVATVTATTKSQEEKRKQIIETRRKKFILREVYQIRNKCDREKELLRKIDTTPEEKVNDLKILIGKYKSVKKQICSLIEEQHERMGWEKTLFGNEKFPKYDPRKSDEKPTDWYKKLTPEVIVLIARNLGVPEDMDC